MVDEHLTNSSSGLFLLLKGMSIEYWREVARLGLGGEKEDDCCGDTAKDFLTSVIC